MLPQEDVRLDGWAIEARLYAEDPARGFLPSSGRLNRYRPPVEGRNGEAVVRIDSGVTEGSEITIHYDPLIAKLVANAGDRAAATEAMGAALDRFVVEGPANNRVFLAAIMASEAWREARLSTAFIAEAFAHGPVLVPDAGMLARLAAVALAIELHDRQRLATLAGRLDGAGGRFAEDWVVTVGDQRLTLAARRDADGALAIGPKRGRRRAVTSDWRPGETIWSGTVGGEAMVVQVHRCPEGLRLSCRGVAVVARVMTPRVAELAALMPAKRVSDAARVLRCPMPGLVVQINVGAGQVVRAGEPLAVVEAMKMENVLRAERDATVARLAVAVGDSLAVDDVIMEFE
jgi:propionyl-CoA carboxylase alpha chain